MIQRFELKGRHARSLANSCRNRRPLTGGYRPFLGCSKKFIKDTTTYEFIFSHPENCSIIIINFDQTSTLISSWINKQVCIYDDLFFRKSRPLIRLIPC